MQIYTEVVEIDPVVASLATEWFGFVQDERMKLHIADGVDHIKKLAKDGEQERQVIRHRNISCFFPSPMSV